MIYSSGMLVGRGRNKEIKAMKKLIFLFSLVSVTGIGTGTTVQASAGASSAKGTAARTMTAAASEARDELQIWCSPDLYGLASLWAEHYGQGHPEARVEILPASADPLDQALKSGETIGFVTRPHLSRTVPPQAWRMVVGRDVIVPVMNPANPSREEYLREGLTREKFISMLARADNSFPGNFNGTDRPARPARIYWYDSGSVKACLGAFLRAEPSDTRAVQVDDADELLALIQGDPHAMGFCRLADLLNEGTGQFDSRLELIPVDVNGNGKLDYFESIYGNPEDFLHGVRIGKYPRELCGDVFCTAADRPGGKSELAFLEWVIGEGQQYLSPGGFTPLMASESYNRIQSLYAGNNPIPEISEARAPGSGPLLLAAGVFLLLVLSFLAARFYRRRRAGLEEGRLHRPPVFDLEGVLVPGGLYFDRTHTWTFMEKDGTVRIGLDDFLQHITGRISKIKMKQPSDRISKGKAFFSVIQDGKQLEVYAPISGVIREVNDRLIRDATVINRSPYMDGWIYRVEPDNWTGEIRGYLMGEKYRTWLKKEYVRLKDFIMTHLNPEVLENSTVVMQEGGELSDNLLENLGPLYWEVFQTSFLDTHG